MTPLEARPYEDEDHAACIRVFDSNVPRFFRKEERPEYAAFLTRLPGPYFVLVEPAEEVVGCGGYAISPDSGIADLCWGMVLQQWHGKGAGKALTMLRIERIREDDRVRTIALSTSQHTAEFYERLGFKETGVDVDGHAPGLDRVHMRLELRP